MVRYCFLFLQVVYRDLFLKMSVSLQKVASYVQCLPGLEEKKEKGAQKEEQSKLNWA